MVTPFFPPLLPQQTPYGENMQKHTVKPPLLLPNGGFTTAPEVSPFCRRGPGEPKTHPETQGKTRCKKGGPKGGQRGAKRHQKRLQNEAGRVILTSLRPFRRGLGPKRVHVHDETVFTMFQGHHSPPGDTLFGVFLAQIKPKCSLKRDSGTRR